jgi:hypothetical protein
MDNELNLEDPKARSTLKVRFCAEPNNKEDLRAYTTIPDPRDPTKKLIEIKEKRIVMYDKDAKGLLRLLAFDSLEFKLMKVLLEKSEPKTNRGAESDESIAIIFNIISSLVAMKITREGNTTQEIVEDDYEANVPIADDAAILAIRFRYKKNNTSLIPNSHK